MKSIEQSWYNRSLLTLLLLPLSALFCLLVAIRQRLYRLGLLKSYRLAVPVIVVGNITVGGTGKTPVVIWLARWLRERGWRPGIITRGYGGKSTQWPQRVEADSPALEVGDEALLLRRRSNCPVYAGPKRYESGRQLLAEHPCDIIISDDGLQHYALQRDLELVVIDGERRFGNGLCLPAGPLRETQQRLKRVDLLLVNGRPGQGEHPLQVIGEKAISVSGCQQARPLKAFTGMSVVAVAGIGNPGRFFSMLESVGVKITRHVFPDHHPFNREDLLPFEGKTVLMTEKDAVKCEAFAGDDVWYVPADATFEITFTKQLELLIDRLTHG